MSIPNFEELMLPLLEVCGDGSEHTFGEAVETLAHRFNLSSAETAELLPSGRYPRFRHRIGWARTDMVKAGLLESTGKGRIRITERGGYVLAKKPPGLDRKYLRTFPEYLAWEKSSTGREPPGPNPPDDGQTPEEVIAYLYESLRAALATDLLEAVKKCPPDFFERLVVHLLVEMGYGASRRDAGQAVGQTGDGGIDGVIKQDRLGLDEVYIQAKRWQNTVGRPTVHAFVGALEGRGASRGVLLTTASFSHEAREYVKNIQKRVVLVDGKELAQLMIEHGVGVLDADTYTMKKMDPGYFADDELA